MAVSNYSALKALEQVKKYDEAQEKVDEYNKAHASTEETEGSGMRMTISQALKVLDDKKKYDERKDNPLFITTPATSSAPSSTTSTVSIKDRNEITVKNGTFTFSDSLLWLVVLLAAALAAIDKHRNQEEKRHYFTFLAKWWGICATAAFAILLVIAPTQKQQVSVDVQEPTAVTESYKVPETEPSKKNHEENYEDETQLNEWDWYEDISDSYVDSREITWHETPDSTAFSEVGYCYGDNTLEVIFRNSGKEYSYYNVPEDVWLDFFCADSMGQYFNSNIKWKYEYELIEYKIPG